MPKGSHEEVAVDRLPECDLCQDGTAALYDGKTTQGPWGYMCQHHFDAYGVGLGLGRGQRLVVREQ